MLDLAALATVLSNGAKVAAAAKAAYSAARDGHLAGDAKAWSELVQTTQAALDSTKGLTVPSAPSPRAVVVSLAVAAFLGAFEEHWAHDKAMAPMEGSSPLKRAADAILGREVRELQLQIALRIAMTGIASDPEDAAILGPSPTSGRLYERLWSAFTEDAPDDAVRAALQLLARDPGQRIDPLVLNPNVSKSSFETAFRERFRVLRAAKAAALDPYAEHLAMSRRDGLLLQGLQAMAAWAEQHVFARLGDQIPLLPLADLYVEPSSVEMRPGPEPSDAQSPIRRPILDVMRSHLDAPEPRLLVVLGDFGLGKSLSARMFVSELARTLLGSSEPTEQSWWPVYVSCGQTWIEGAFDLKRLVADALQWLCESRGIPIASDDEALAPPGREQRQLIVLDGLDERALSPAELTSLLRALRGLTTGLRRFVILSRPAILEPILLGERKGGSGRAIGTRVVALEEFELTSDRPGLPSRVEAWLGRWNRLARPPVPITVSMLEERGIAEIAKTPVLLFVIAFGWEQGLTQGGRVARATLYEGFMRRVVRGKLAETGEENRPIAAAARTLADHLLGKGHVANDATAEDALLWVLSLIAWEAHVRAQKPEAREFDRTDVENVLRDRLDSRSLRDQDYGLVIDGVLLALQHSSRPGAARILYGHKSFREFLVAWYWDRQLRRIVEGREKALWTSLQGGLVDVDSDAATSFLDELLQAWTPANLDHLFRQAEEQFADDTIESPRGRASLREDLRIELRHSAMVLCAVAHEIGMGSAQERVRVLEIRTGYILTSLAAGLDAKQVKQVVWRFSGAELSVTIPQAMPAEQSWRISGCTFCDCEIDRFYVGMGSVIDDSIFRNVVIATIETGPAAFRRVTFESTEIYGGRFLNAVFLGSNLDGCLVNVTLFRMCTFSPSGDRATVLPHGKANQFHRCKINRATFSNFRLESARFEETRFMSMSVDARALFRSTFHDCHFDHVTFLELESGELSFVRCTFEECSGAPSTSNSSEPHEAAQVSANPTDLT